MTDFYQPITRREADFLNRISSAATNLRQSARYMNGLANKTLENLENAQRPSLPNHQTMQEFVKYSEEVRTLLEMVWFIFDIRSKDTEADRIAYRAEVEGYLTLALKTSDDRTMAGDSFYFMSHEDKK